MDLKPTTPLIRIRSHVSLRPEINEHQNCALLRDLPCEEKKCPALSKLSAPVRFLSALRALAPFKKIGAK